MSTETDLEFAQVVAKKMDLAIKKGKTRDQRQTSGKRVLQAYLLNPDTGQSHQVIRQQLSHIVETPDASTKLDSQIVISAEPQRVLVQPNGLLQLLMSRETIPIHPDGIAETKASVVASEPVTESELAKIKELDITRLLDRSTKFGKDTLQARVQSLLRSGMFSSRYVAVGTGISLVNDQLEQRKVVRAVFDSHYDATVGTISNDIVGRTLSQDSISATLNFPTTREIASDTERWTTKALDIDIVGDGVVDLDRMVGLDGTTVAYINRIFDVACLVPLRDV